MVFLWGLVNNPGDRETTNLAPTQTGRLWIGRCLLPDYGFRAISLPKSVRIRATVRGLT